MKETEGICSKPNYEEMYHKLQEENCKIREENAYLYEKLKAIQQAHDTLSAQMGVVHLIFGGNR